MRPRVAVIVLSGVLVGMFGVALSQNSNTGRNSNVMPNSNQARGNGKRYANYGNGNANYRHPGAWVDGNTNRPLVNGTWNANANHWDIDENLLYANAAANIPANGVRSNAVNAAKPAKKPARKKTRRPSAGMGGALSFENMQSAMLAAGVGRWNDEF